MDRVGHLIKTAAEVRRMVWASLPFSQRFATVMYRLGSSSADAFGTGIYQLFLEHGVLGMPDINGQPAAEFRGRRLPSTYGREFGKKVYLLVSKKFKDPNLVEDAMGNLLLDFLARKEKLNLQLGTTLRKAENYVIVSVNRRVLDTLRRKKYERNESDLRTRNDEDSGPGYLDMSPAPERELDQGALQETLEKAMEQILNRSEVKAALKRIHPAAEQYARLMLDGYEDTEILGSPAMGKPSMLSDAKMPNGGKLTPQSFTPYKKKIKALLMSEATAAAEALGIAV